MAGYSGTPLIKKIGIKPGDRVILRNHPPTFLKDLGKTPEGVTQSDRLSGQAAVIIYFTSRLAELKRDFSLLSKTLVPDGMLWIAWPKKASGQPTDLNENIIREVGLDAGFVDIKVCAIDDVWSGLKFVIRLKDRAAKSAGKAAKAKKN
jgi:hypothetical protein